MRAENFDKILDQIVEKDPRFHRDAYLFVREALDHTQRIVAKAFRGAAKPESKHVSGQELLAGIRTSALELFGPMAFMVLEEWGVHRCEDFGEIVFNLIDIGQMKKTSTDRREDFANVFDFDDGLRDAFLPITSDS